MRGTEQMPGEKRAVQVGLCKGKLLFAKNKPKRQKEEEKVGLSLGGNFAAS